MLGFLARLIGSSNEKEVRRLAAVLDRVNSLEPSMKALRDEELAAKTAEFKSRLANGESLDAILPEAFAVVRETSARVLGMRPFDVQVMGGVVLHEGNIAEMKTGEGKTLVATMPVYLNALEGKGVHVVTVNDYLAKRDAEWMGPIYRFLGLTVGVIVHGLSTVERQRAYRSDITYGTNNEFGFDYLRDNMAIYPDQVVQRELHYAIVDEVDSILIDEARTPLIISGPSVRPPDLYYKFAYIARQLKEGEDYEVDEKARSVTPTERGVAKVERILGIGNLFDHENRELSHYLNQALRAKALMKRDRDYVVKDGQVIIVDEFTGRLMFGRRYSDGLHQAIEAKEGVKIQRETQTLATITFQNYFRMYKKLAGMTGTAASEAEEFRKIYGLDVVVIPTNKPMIRKDYPDCVYATVDAKFNAVADEVEELHRKGRPVLVGTVSIEKSERLSELLARRGIPHQVLNAKHHEKEAEIIAKAGQAGAVTIATNMAGRGTDIVLGEGVAALGGLHVIGTERHEARRIDDQLRGRSGRQGDPGSSRFYLSLEDDLMRLFGGDLLHGLFDRLKLDHDQPLEHPLLTRAIERAQKRVEAHNFELRRRLLEYDDVMNKQREVIYAQRRAVLEGRDLRGVILEMVADVARALVDRHAPSNADPEHWDLEGLAEEAKSAFCLADLPQDLASVLKGDISRLWASDLKEAVVRAATSAYQAKEAEIGPEIMRELERQVLLRVVDARWMEHLDRMDDLREGVGLVAYGQRDPFLEYQVEAHALFTSMVESIREDTVRLLFRVAPASEAARAGLAGPTQPSPAGKVARPPATPETALRPEAVSATSRRPAVTSPPTGASARWGSSSPGPGGGPVVGPGFQKGKKKIGRNDPCPCGSGKKYKKCCGKIA